MSASLNRRLKIAAAAASLGALMTLAPASPPREPLSMAELVRRSGLTKPTAHRITAALADIRRDGYCLSRDEMTDDASSVAAP